MTKKILAFLFCICLMAECVNAAQKEDIRVVVFDFGGVIAKANRAEMIAFFTNALGIDEKELKIALKEMQKHVSSGGSEKEYWENYAVAKKINLPCDWFNQFEDVIRRAITEIPGTLTIVKELQRQGYQTAMLSDVTQYQSHIIRKMGYYDFFYPVLLSNEIGVEKPNPQAFQILLQRLELPASAILFIDDKIENVEAAKKQGIDAIQFVSPKQLKEELEKRGFDFNKISDTSSFCVVVQY